MTPNIFRPSLLLPLSLSITYLLAPHLSAYIAYAARGNTAGATIDSNKAISNVFDNGSNPRDDTAQGIPAKFSWSIVPDGTLFAGSYGSSTIRVSDIVAAWDAAHSVAVEDQIDDLTLRPWFAGLSDALELIEKRSGIEYIYSPEDDGDDSYVYYDADIGDYAPGVAGVRGDLRFAGAAGIGAGAFSSSSAGSLYYPDINMNTANISGISAVRYVFGHETMHSLGFDHSTVNGTRTQSAVAGSGGTGNGPQFDDIYGLHRKYGDFYEKNGGNDTQALAIDLGTVAPSESIIIGDDANDTTVAIDEFDFISIDDDSDTDFLKFTLESEQEVTITLEPRGPEYTNRNTDAIPTILAVTLTTIENSDLAFRLLNSSGQQLNSVSSTGIGENEVLTTTLAAGEYAIEVTGSANDTQLYALEVQSNELATGYGSWATSEASDSDEVFDTDFISDPDGDGLANGIEYMLSADPEALTSNPLQNITRNGGDLVLSFERNAASTEDTTQVLQYCSDLLDASWTDVSLTGSVAATVAIGSEVDGMETVTVTVPESEAIDQKLFWRLKVTQD